MRPGGRSGELVATQARLREAHEVAGLSSWEWHPESDEVIVFQALSGVAELSGTRVSFNELLGAMSVDDRKAARNDLDAMARGERERSVRGCRYDLPTGQAWLETRSRAVRDREGRLVCIRGTTQDVTESHLAVEGLARSRDFFQATLDSLRMEIVVLDERGDVIMCNRAWTAFAAANDALTVSGIGVNYLSACDTANEGAGARTAVALREIIAGTRQEFTIEYPCHGPELERWFALRATRYDGPGPAQVVVAHDEITARRQAEVEISTQAALLDDVDVAVVAIDRVGQVIRWNAGAVAMFGHSRSEAIGHRATQLIAGDDSVRAEEAIAATEHGGHWDGLLNFQRKDGSGFPGEVRVRQIVGDDGLGGGRIAVIADVSKRVASERALVAAHNYAHAVADSMGEGLCTTDPQGRLTYMNKAAERLLGWSAAKVKGQRLHDLVHAARPGAEGCDINTCPIMRGSREAGPVRVEDDCLAAAREVCCRLPSPLPRS